MLILLRSSHYSLFHGHFLSLCDLRGSEWGDGWGERKIRVWTVDVAVTQYTFQAQWSEVSTYSHTLNHILSYIFVLVFRQQYQLNLQRRTFTYKWTSTIFKPNEFTQSWRSLSPADTFLFFAVYWSFYIWSLWLLAHADSSVAVCFMSTSKDCFSRVARGSTSK